MANHFHSSQIKQLEYKEFFSQTKQLNNEELLSQTKQLVQKERNMHIQVLYHLSELESRKLYLEQGFSSLFDYATRELGYSEGAAYRRIKAMRLCRDLPGTENRLQSGRLSLSSACELQVFFEKQAKKKKALIKTLKKEPLKTLSPISQGGFPVCDKLKGQESNTSFRLLNQEEKEDLVKKAEGCSTRATVKLLSETDPALSFPREKTRFLGKGKVEIKAIIDEKCHKRLKELKNLLSHKNPNLSYGELFAILSEEALKKHDPRKRHTRQQKTSSPHGEQKNEIANRKVTSAPKKSEERDQVLKPAETVLKKATSAQKWKLKDKPDEKKSISVNRLRPKDQTLELIEQVFRKPVTSTKKSEHKPHKISRAIPSHLRKYIWKRDKGQCTYIHQATSHRCKARHLLQIGHIQPFALGGKTEKGNLRLLCASHNRYRR